mmetsp:Transcript_19336/g.44340  ORF Transcript_19336/g.44340 Transcript_19336/m.44340 type:complete len:131 (+) Transcript_19336:770-1162(+)
MQSCKLIWTSGGSRERSLRMRVGMRMRHHGSGADDCGVLREDLRVMASRASGDDGAVVEHFMILSIDLMLPLMLQDPDTVTGMLRLGSRTCMDSTPVCVLPVRLIGLMKLAIAKDAVLPTCFGGQLVFVP